MVRRYRQPANARPFRKESCPALPGSRPSTAGSAAPDFNPRVTVWPPVIPPAGQGRGSARRNFERELGEGGRASRLARVRGVDIEELAEPVAGEILDHAIDADRVTAGRPW